MNIAIIVSYVAVALTSASYWFQIWHIHKHKEVRDLSVPGYITRALGSLMLCWTALELENSVIFFIKNFLIVIPAVIILLQIWYHKEDTYV